MIEVRTINKDGVLNTTRLHTKEGALRFMYKMKGMGYLIYDYVCDSPWDNEWLNRRFKQ